MPPTFLHHREHVDAVLSTVLDAANPRRLMRDALATNPIPAGPCHLLAFGKAAVQMSLAAGEALGDRIRFGMCTFVPGTVPRPKGFPPTVGTLPADHPLPTDQNVEAATAIQFIASDFASCSGEGNMSTLVVLISGGGSAHLTLPAADLTLDDLRRTAAALLRTGATIAELNCVRKHLEQLKGGRLAQLAFPGRVRAFVLSDVVGDALDVIASGPCAPDPTTYADALAVMDKHGLTGEEHHRARRHLEDGNNGLFAETPKPGDPALDRVHHTLIGNHLTGLAAAKDTLAKLGFPTIDARAEVTGEARDVGKLLVEHALTLRDTHGGPVAAIFAGETTVTVRGQGIGGRNQEMALSMALALESKPDCAAFAFATDGMDGTTGAAGALVTGQTAAKARLLRLDPHAMLEKNDSTTLFTRLDLGGAGTLIKTDPTGTNINDLFAVLAY
jgi:glycerate-2-kinase